MSLYKRNDIWWYRFKFRNAHIRESSKSGNKSVAERLEREHRRRLELNQGGLTDIAKPKKCSSAMTEIREINEAHWAKKTRKIHANSQLQHLDPFFGHMFLSEITSDDIAKYQGKRHKEKASNRTINIEVSLLRLALKKHKLWAHIADDVKMLKENKDIGRELTDDEQHRLLTACKASASRSLYPAVLTSIHTGLRNQELRLLKWRQVDLLNCAITVGKSKTQGGEGRLVPLSQTALQVLQEWRSRFPAALPDHYVFPREAYGTNAVPGKKGFPAGCTTVAYETFPDQHVQTFATSWRTAKKVAGVECRWHDMRHSFVSLIAAGGATDGTIQALAGWMSPKMIERYSHIRNLAKQNAIAVLDKPRGHKTGHTINSRIAQNAVSN